MLNQVCLQDNTNFHIFLLSYFKHSHNKLCQIESHYVTTHTSTGNMIELENINMLKTHPMVVMLKMANCIHQVMVNH